MLFKEGYIKENTGGIPVYRSGLFKSLGIAHAFSTREGGVSKGCYSSMNLTFSTGDSSENIMENMRRFTGLIGSSPENCVKTEQVHGTIVRTVSAVNAGEGLLRESKDCDGLATAEKGLTLMVLGADCSLMLLYDIKNNICAAAHGGWRGCAGRIGSEAVKAMNRLGSKSSDIYVALMPCILPCCFHTDGDVPEAIRKNYPSECEEFITDTGNDRYTVDIQKLNAYSLVLEGLNGNNIELIRKCTCCSDEFFSHRRDKTARGGMAAIIRI